MELETSQVLVWGQFILDAALISAVVGLAIAWKVSLTTVTRSAEFRESVAAAVEAKIHTLTSRCETLENSWRDWHEKHQRVAQRLNKVEGLAKAKAAAEEDDAFTVSGPAVDRSSFGGSEVTAESSEAERDVARAKLTREIYLARKSS